MAVGMATVAEIEPEQAQPQAQPQTQPPSPPSPIAPPPPPHRMGMAGPEDIEPDTIVNAVAGKPAVPPTPPTIWDPSKSGIFTNEEMMAPQIGRIEAKKMLPVKEVEEGPTSPKAQTEHLKVTKWPAEEFGAMYDAAISHGVDPDVAMAIAGHAQQMLAPRGPTGEVSGFEIRRQGINTLNDGKTPIDDDSYYKQQWDAFNRVHIVPNLGPKGNRAFYQEPDGTYTSVLLNPYTNQSVTGSENRNVVPPKDVMGSLTQHDAIFFDPAKKQWVTIPLETKRTPINTASGAPAQNQTAGGYAEKSLPSGVIPASVAAPPVKEKGQVFSAMTTKGMIQATRELLAQNPGEVGPFMGRVNALVTKFGGDADALTGSTDFGTLEGHIAYLFLNEAQATMPGRPAAQWMDFVHNVSAQITQNPKLLEQRLRAAENNANIVLGIAAQGGYDMYGAGAKNKQNAAGDFGPVETKTLKSGQKVRVRLNKKTGKYDPAP